MTGLPEICREVLGTDPARDAIDFEGRWYSWGDVQNVARALQAVLAASGIGPADPVTLVPRNEPSALAAFPALLEQGRSIRMVYAFQGPAAKARAIARLDSGVVIMAAEDFSDEVKAVLAEREMAGIALTQMDARAVPGFETCRPRGDAPPVPQVAVLTSGTTGPPKQFPIPYGVIAQFARRQGITAMGDQAYDAPPFLMTFPIGNISGLYSVAASFLGGMRVELHERFSVQGWRNYVVKYRPEHSGAPPAAVSMILDADIPKEDLASIRFFGTGAAPLDPTIQRRFEEKYDIPIILSYGATEFGGPVVAMTPQLHREFAATKPGTVGRPMEGVKLRLRDPETDKILDQPATGILEVVSPRMGPEWIRTSDLIRIDEDGFVFCMGRADGAIMRGGFKILPETVEQALMLHPAISAASVVGVADRRLHQVPAAAIELKPGAGEVLVEDLAAFLREHVPSTHIPAHWKIVDSLPKTVSFKIDRPAVRRLFEEQ